MELLPETFLQTSPMHGASSENVSEQSTSLKCGTRIRALHLICSSLIRKLHELNLNYNLYYIVQPFPLTDFASATMCFQAINMYDDGRSGRKVTAKEVFL